MINVFKLHLLIFLLLECNYNKVSINHKMNVQFKSRLTMILYDTVA